MQQFAQRAALICLAALALCAMASGAAFGQSKPVAQRGAVKLDPKGLTVVPRVDLNRTPRLNLDLEELIHADPAPGELPDQTRTPARSVNQKLVGPAEPAPGEIGQARLTITAPIQTDTAVPEDPNAIVVAIRFNNRGKADLCTGTLIDATHVLTAGHCACGDSYEVVFKDTEVGKTGRPIAGAPIPFDPSICRDFRPTGNDLALLTLQSPITCNVVPGSLDQVTLQNGLFLLKNGGLPPTDCRNKPNAGNFLQTFGYPDTLFFDLIPRLKKAGKLTAIGYGFTENHTLGVRMRADISIRSVACTEPTFAVECSPYSEMILGERLGQGDRKDTCGGDSGGPVFLMENGRYTLVAVTSRATLDRPDIPELGCGGGGIYTVVARNSVIQWLQANGVWPTRIFATTQAIETGPSQSRQ